MRANKCGRCARCGNFANFSVSRSFPCQMRNPIAWFLIFFSLGGFRVECVQCPNHCFCYAREGLLKTECVRRNLINTFVGFSHLTQILDLSHNVISILHGNEFLDANLKQLQEIRLSNNRLHKIDKFSFNGLTLLKNLDLSVNSIEYLNPTTFKYNPNLQTLNVSFNPLAVSVGEPFLNPAPPLQVLDVTDCHLRSVTPLTFSLFTRLRVLNVSRTDIQNLEFTDGLESLRYLDVSMNPCNDQTKTWIRSLANRNIQVRSSCKTNQKLVVIPVVADAVDTNGSEFGLLHRKEDGENVTQRFSQQRSLLDDVTHFFQSIPSFYAIICGIQLGIFIGSFSTYFCLKKSFKRQAVEEVTRYRNGEPDNLTFALIPLNTPPGTPPSPYRSRFFPSTFSLPAT